MQITFMGQCQEMPVGNCCFYFRFEISQFKRCVNSETRMVIILIVLCLKYVFQNYRKFSCSAFPSVFSLIERWLQNYAQKLMHTRYVKSFYNGLIDAIINIMHWPTLHKYNNCCVFLLLMLNMYLTIIIIIIHSSLFMPYIFG